jgi:SdpC family antimicrobial peptide
MNEISPQTESRQLPRAAIVRRLSSAVAIVAAVAVTISFINSVYSDPQKVQAARPYDGLTLYRALFFASGPVAAKIPTIQKAAPYLPADYKNLEGQITKYIQAKDPAYFDNFARDIQSGDRVRVSEAIKRTSKLQREAMLAVTTRSKAQFATQVRRLRVEKEPDPEAENDANVAVEVLVFVLIFVTVFWESPKSRPTQLKGLSFERYVDEVTRAVPKAQTLKSAP